MREKLIRRYFGSLLTATGLLLSLYSIAGCAVERDEKELYSVEFDTRFGDQNSTVLDYRYARNSELLMAPIPEELNDGKGMFASGRAQWMQHGTSLFVKWRDDDSGAVHEDTVDLRGKLPADMSRKDIYFTVKGSQLSVYVLSKSEPSDLPPSERPFFARGIKFIKIYPK